jgi:hypothetical protein
MKLQIRIMLESAQKSSKGHGSPSTLLIIRTIAASFPKATLTPQIVRTIVISFLKMTPSTLPIVTSLLEATFLILPIVRTIVTSFLKVMMRKGVIRIA